MTTIEKTNNGAVITVEETDEEGNPIKNKYCFEFDRENPEEEDVGSIAQMIYTILEDELSIILSNLKHNKYSLEIKTIHGWNYECEGCEICKGD